MFEKTIATKNTAELQRFRVLDAATATDADKKAARALLDGIAVSMVSENGRSVRSGNLRIYANEDGTTRFALKRFSRNEHNDQANELVRKLVEIGYADHPQGATQALDQYLNTSGQKMGSQSLFKLVKSHSLQQSRINPDEATPDEILDADWRRGGLLQREARIDISHMDEDIDVNFEAVASDGESTVLVQSQASSKESEGGISTNSQVQAAQAQVQQAVQPLQPSYVMPSTQVERQKERMDTFANAGVQVQKLLGQGANGAAYQATLNGQQVVVKTNAEAMPFTLNRTGYIDSRFAGNIGHSVYLGAPSKNVPNFLTDKIVAPTHYLVRRSENDAPEVMTAVQAKAFLKGERQAGRVALCEGEIMPMATGEPGLDVINKRLDDAIQAELFTEMLKMGRELQGRGLLHRDLKPENMFIDPQSGKIQVFDWDFSYKISSKQNPGAVTPALFVGSPLYLCPKVAQGRGYAGDADLHSMGMIMLNARYPRVFDRLVDPVAALVRAGARGFVPSTFEKTLMQAARSLNQRIPEELARIEGIKSRNEQGLATVEARLALLNQPQGTGQAVSVGPVQNRAFEVLRLESERSRCMRNIQIASRDIATLKGQAEELAQFLQETSDEQIANSLTGAALQCVRLANEQPTAKWISRNQAQEYYRLALAHPALAQAQVQSQPAVQV